MQIKYRQTFQQMHIRLPTMCAACGAFALNLPDEQMVRSFDDRALIGARPDG